MVTRQLRLMYHVKSMFDQNMPMYEIQRRLELQKDYQVKAASAQSKGYKLEKLQELYERSIEYEEGFKTGKMGEQEALDSIITLINNESVKHKGTNQKAYPSYY